MYTIYCAFKQCVITHGLHSIIRHVEDLEQCNYKTCTWSAGTITVDLPHGYLSAVSYVCLACCKTSAICCRTTYKISHKRLHYRPTCRQQVGSAHMWNGICISKAEPQKAQKEIISMTSSSVWLPPSPSLALPPFPLLPPPSPPEALRNAVAVSL